MSDLREVVVEFIQDEKTGVIPWKKVIFDGVCEKLGPLTSKASFIRINAESKTIYIGSADWIQSSTCAGSPDSFDYRQGFKQRDSDESCDSKEPCTRLETFTPSQTVALRTFKGTCKEVEGLSLKQVVDRKVTTHAIEGFEKAFQSPPSQYRVGDCISFITGVSIRLNADFTMDLFDEPSCSGTAMQNGTCVTFPSYTVSGVVLLSGPLSDVTVPDANPFFPYDNFSSRPWEKAEESDESILFFGVVVGATFFIMIVAVIGGKWAREQFLRRSTDPDDDEYPTRVFQNTERGKTVVSVATPGPAQDRV